MRQFEIAPWRNFVVIAGFRPDTLAGALHGDASPQLHRYGTGRVW
jgi:hypothetical protein